MQQSTHVQSMLAERGGGVHPEVQVDIRAWRCICCQCE